MLTEREMMTCKRLKSRYKIIWHFVVTMGEIKYESLYGCNDIFIIAFSFLGVA